MEYITLEKKETDANISVISSPPIAASTGVYFRRGGMMVSAILLVALFIGYIGKYATTYRGVCRKVELPFWFRREGPVFQI